MTTPLDIWDAANRLSRDLRDKPWYHRCTVRDERCDACGQMHVSIEVWGEFVGGKRPEEVPTTYQGHPVGFNRVSPRHECTFGSVRARTRSLAEQNRTPKP